MTRYGMLTWDWKEDPNWDGIAALLAELTDGRIHFHNVNTESDQIAVVFADGPIDPNAIDEAYRDDQLARCWKAPWSAPLVTRPGAGGESL